MSNKLSADQTANPKARRSPWFWIPSLYFAEGIPYVVVMTVAVIMYKKLGISNTKIALYTSWLYLPWVIKPFWSPLVDLFRTKRWWIVSMQLLIGAGLAGVALTIPTNNFLQYTMMFLWLLAFSSATHDIAADGFYMLGLSSHDQAWFVGIRSTFYRLAMIAGQGLLVMFAGALEEHYGLPEAPVTIQAAVEKSVSYEFNPNDVAFTSERSGQQQILIASDPHIVALEEQDPKRVAELISKVRDWNIKRGFYQEEIKADQVEREKAGWLKSLESWIVHWFGPSEKERAKASGVGDVVIIHMRLAQPLRGDEERTVNFSYSSGDKSFQVVEGPRFTMNSENSDHTFAAVIQVDSRLNRPSQASFRALSGNNIFAWKYTFFLLAVFFLLVCIYHYFSLPHPPSDLSSSTKGLAGVFQEFFIPFQSFFRKKGIMFFIIFLLCYRFSEAQLVKLASPFLLDDNTAGGLALSTGEVGFVYGTIGVVMLTLGGILGGLLAAKHGLKSWLIWMVLAINLPNAVYVVLSFLQPQSFLAVNLAVGVEQFGYGFGFTAYMLFMLYIAKGEHETAHYAICTGFMALGMMLPGMLSGWLQELVGYQNFFVWVMISTIPSFAVCWFMPLDPEFGKASVQEKAD